jgi:hypothetical protein
MSGTMIDRSMKLERINLYVAEYVEEPLTFVRCETTYALLGINLATGDAYVEEGEGIGTVPLLDAEIEALYGEILRRKHTHLGHGT